MRQGSLVGSGLVALLVTFSLGCGGTASAPGAAGSTRTPRAAAGPAAQVADLKLESLARQEDPTGLDRVGRNLFRYGAATSPVRDSEEPSLPRVVLPPPSASGATGEVALTPIPLRYIGLLEAPSQGGRVGILTDGRGNIFYGRDGDTIEGRYLVVQVGTTAIELSYLDGRGRQTVRLTGQ